MFTVFGILLLIAGAILTFAVEQQAEGVDLQAVGWILMGGGAASLLLAAVRGASFMSGRSQRVHRERIVSEDGQHVVEEQRTA